MKTYLVSEIESFDDQEGPVGPEIGEFDSLEEAETCGYNSNVVFFITIKGDD